jgi:hypothetical protein
MVVNQDGGFMHKDQKMEQEIKVYKKKDGCKNGLNAEHKFFQFSILFSIWVSSFHIFTVI